MNRLAIDKPIATRGVLSDDELRGVDAYWRASNYLAASMLYLRDNPLLREPLAVEHIEQRLVGLRPRSESRVGPPQSSHQAIRSERDPIRWTRPWRLRDH